MPTTPPSDLSSHCYRTLRSRIRSTTIHPQELPDLTQSAVCSVLSSLSRGDYTSTAMRSIVWLACRSAIRDWVADKTGTRAATPPAVTQAEYHLICCASRRQPTRAARECRNRPAPIVIQSDAMNDYRPAPAPSREYAITPGVLALIRSERDREVADCLSRELSQHDIARELELGRCVVQRSIARIHRDLALFDEIDQARDLS